MGQTRSIFFRVCELGPDTRYLLGRPHDSGIFDRTEKKVIVYYEVAMECLRRKERPVRRSLVGLFTGTCQPCHDHYYV